MMPLSSSTIQKNHTGSHIPGPNIIQPLLTCGVIKGEIFLETPLAASCVS
jgi:hypothetical protein